MSSDVALTSSTADREILTTRLIDAPRALVFEAFTTSEHLDRWWGPDGFRNTTASFEFKPGGKWSFIMHGPDGVDYLNIVVFDEIIPNERLTYAHSGGDDDRIQFKTTIDFLEERGKTRIVMRAVFPSAEMRDFVAREVGAVEGAEQHLGNLSSYVAQREVESGEFTVTRVFEAPRALVFEAWTRPEHLAEWWGRHGHMLPVCEVDAVTGGRFKFCMRASDGAEYWVAGEYHEVSPPARLVFTCGLIHTSPTHDALWTVTFDEADSGTVLRLHQKLFDQTQAREGAKSGLVECLERLETLVASLVRGYCLSCVR